MPFRVEIDPQTGVGLGVFTGSCDFACSKQALVELWNEPGWNGRAAVWDVRSASLDITVDDVQVFAQFVLHNQPALPPSRVAIVASGDLNFATMRMFEGYRDDPRTETRVMRDFDEAVGWANSAPPPTPHPDRA